MDARRLGDRPAITTVEHRRVEPARAPRSGIGDGASAVLRHSGAPVPLVRDALPGAQRSAGNARTSRLVVQRDAEAGTSSEASVTVRWSDDDVEFFQRTVAATARAPAFAKGGRASLYQPLHTPVIALHRTLAPRLGSGYRGTIRLAVSGSVSRGWVRDIRVTQVGTAPGQAAPPPNAEQVAAGESGRVAGLLRLLGNASKLRRATADIDVMNRNGELEIVGWQARGDDGPTSEGIDWRRTRDSIASTLALVGLATHSTFIYAVHLDSSGGFWDAPRFQRLAEILPLPEPSAGGGGPGYDEAQEIIDDVRSKRRLVLDTAAMLIAEQDPTRWQNLVTMAAPFAIVKLGRFTNVARITVAANLRRLRMPKVSQLTRGHHMVKASFDTRLVEIARELRATQAGFSARDFGANNIAVARIRVNGEVRYIDAGNTPASVLGASRGLDSEQMLLTQVQELRGAGRANDVRIEQLYSERIPCVTCTRMLDDLEPGAAVFYTVPERFHDSMDGASRGRALMTAYGVE